MIKQYKNRQFYHRGKRLILEQVNDLVEIKGLKVINHEGVDITERVKLQCKVKQLRGVK